VGVRDEIEKIACAADISEYPDAKVLMGTSTAGIPHRGHLRPYPETADGLRAQRQ
jgi:hypothetical protein